MTFPKAPFLISFPMVLVLSTTSAVMLENFKYSQQEKWPEICHIGMRQSPINLDFTTAIEHTIPPFKFVNYDEKYRFVINSDGQTVKFKIKSPHTIKIKGGGLPYEYVLDSITFHNSAEHTINLYRHPMEMQLLHYHDKYHSLNLALTSGEETNLVVLSVMFEKKFSENQVDNSSINSALNAAFEEALQYTNTDIYVKEPIAIQNFLPKNTHRFYRYNGSLTVPECDENVIWSVFTTVSYINGMALEGFRLLQNKNFRNIQQANGRQVALCDSTFTEYKQQQQQQLNSRGNRLHFIAFVVIIRIVTGMKSLKSIYL